LHSLSWAALLLDYGVLIEHDTSTLDSWTLDGDYLHKNLRRITNIHVVCDSDEIFLASWGPMDVSVSQDSCLQQTDASDAVPSQFLWTCLRPVQAPHFLHPVRWHAKPLNAEWARVEQKAARTLGRWLRPQEAIGLKIVLVPLRLMLFVSECWGSRAAMLRRLRQLLRGGPGVREWVA
jgi:hypothetical protein